MKIIKRNGSEAVFDITKTQDVETILHVPFIRRALPHELRNHQIL